MEVLQEFDKVIEHEEMVWFQKFRDNWVALGDRNTKYFHTLTIIRRRRNKKNDENVWISNPSELEQLAVNYYKRLYPLDDVDKEVDKLPHEGILRLTREEVMELAKPFTAI